MIKGAAIFASGTVGGLIVGFFLGGIIANTEMQRRDAEKRAQEAERNNV